MYRPRMLGSQSGGPQTLGDTFKDYSEVFFRSLGGFTSILPPRSVLAEFLSRDRKHFHKVGLRAHILGSVGQETISSSDFGLQISGLFGIVLQSGADLANGGVDALFDINENIFAPQLIRNLLASHELALILDQEHE